MTSESTGFRHLPEAVQEALQSDLTIDITTTGRRTGRPRRIEIWFLAVDGVIYITGTPGRRDWLANLIAEPSFTFHLKESVEVDLAARATVVDDPAERRHVLSSVAAQWYRDQTASDDLMERAPLVRVAFDQIGADQPEP